MDNYQFQTNNPQYDELAAELDRLLPPDEGDLPDRVLLDADEPLVEAAVNLAGDPARPALNDEARERIHLRVLETQAVHHAKLRRSTSRSYWITLLSGVAAAFVLVLLPVISYGSTPGNALYPVKRSVERIEIAAANVTNGQSEVYLRLAERRAREAVALFQRGEVSAELIGETIDNLENAQPDGAAPSEVRDRSSQVTTTIGYIVAYAGASASMPVQVDEAGLARIDENRALLRRPVLALITRAEAAVYDQPRVGSEPVTTLKAGESVYVIGRTQDDIWALVQIGSDRRGWVAQAAVNMLNGVVEE